MTELQQGVNVKTPENLDDGVDHLKSNMIKVSDGHLIVGMGSVATHEVAAIYAPGRWLSAVVTR
jgi:hypothetical protein